MRTVTFGSFNRKKPAHTFNRINVKVGLKQLADSINVF